MKIPVFLSYSAGDSAEDTSILDPFSRQPLILDLSNNPQAMRRWGANSMICTTLAIHGLEELNSARVQFSASIVNYFKAEPRGISGLTVYHG
jgi:hypothetical protein